MKILIITDDRKADEEFIQITKQMVCKENTVGVYDIGRKNQTDIIARYGDRVEYVKDLTPAIMEYYQLAFCLYCILPRLYSKNIYLTSYVKASSEIGTIHCCADFLFLAGNARVEGSAYFLLEGREIKDYVRQILEVTGKMQDECMSEATYPKAVQQNAVKDGEIYIDEEFSMDQIREKRINHVVMTKRFIDLFSKFVDLSVYQTVLEEAVKKWIADEITGAEIIEAAETDSDGVLYEILKANEKKIFEKKDEEIIYALQYIYLVSGHYEDLRTPENYNISRNSFFYYIQGMAAFYLEDYRQCKEFLDKYFALSVSEVEATNVSRKIYEDVDIRDIYEQAMIGLFQPLAMGCEDAYFLIQSMGKKNQDIFYDSLMEKVQDLLEQGTYKECVDMAEAYWKIVKSVGRDRSYNVHMAFSGRMAGKACWKLGKPVKAVKYCCTAGFFFIRKGAVTVIKSIRISNIKRCLKKCKNTIFIKNAKQKIKILICRFLNEMHIYRKDERRILSFKDKHPGERCFILGNDPNLQVEDLERLKKNGEICFASNKIYKFFDKTDWRPDYYACIDVTLFRQNYYSILEKGDYPKFFSNVMIKQDLIRQNENHYIVTYGMKPIERVKFNPLATYIYSGGSVTYVLINLAWLMGFREIYLIGCDHAYEDFDNMNTTSIAVNEDEKAENYITNEAGLDTGNLFIHEQGYQIARKFIESHGGKIYNATRGGKLEVFPRADLDEVLMEKNRK